MIICQRMISVSLRNVLSSCPIVPPVPISVNEAHLDLFARKQCPYNGNPPSEAALVEFIKRSSYRHNIHRRNCYASRKFYHRHPFGVGIKLAAFESNTGHNRRQ